MDIVLSITGETPIYEQIFQQLSAEILNGELKSGECLPPIRAVAAELRISVITVKKAWELLEQAGLIHTMAGKGCFVAPLPGHALDRKKYGLAEERMRKDLAYYQGLGLTLEEVVALVKKIYHS